MKVVNIFGLFRNNSTVLIPESDVWECGFAAHFCFDSIVLGINRARLAFPFVVMGHSLTGFNSSSQERFDVLCP